MENLLGLLRIRVKRGVNLAVRDEVKRSSDPYVLIKMGKQKLRTHTKKKDLNPEWNEDLTLSISDPNLPVKLFVYDKDTFSFDDKMGDAEIDIRPFVEAATTKRRLNIVPDGCILMKRIQPNRQNCLSEESLIYLEDGKLVQNLFLRLRNVESGELELQLQWIDVSS